MTQKHVHEGLLERRMLENDRMVRDDSCFFFLVSTAIEVEKKSYQESEAFDIFSGRAIFRRSFEVW